MKLLISGDWHLTDKAPENRVDNYGDACLGKAEFILQTAKELECNYILQPADFFDSPNPSYELFTKVVKLISNYSTITILTAFGQHDLRYRNPRNTALRALETSCQNVMVGVPLLFPTHPKEIVIKCIGWNEDIPEPTPNAFNILVIHRMIVDEKIWEGQTDFEYANIFLKKNKFDLIVSGDNHKYFVAESGKRLLVNCGGLMRSSIDQVKHEPTLVFFDTEHPDKWYNIDIPIEPAEKVFRMDMVEKTKERNEKLDSFIEGLSTHKEMGMSFGDNLAEYMKTNKIDKAVQDIIWEGMQNG